MDRKDLPLDLIVVADLAPAGSAGEAARDRAHPVDRDSLPELLKRMEPAIELPSGEGGQPAPFRVRLAFPDYRAFRPESLAARLPATRGLFALKRAIAERTPDAAGLRAAIESITEPPELVAALRRALEGGGAPPPRPAAPAAPAAAGPAPAPARPAPRPAGGEGSLDALFELVDASAPPAEAASPAQAARVQGALDALVAEFTGAVRAPGTVPTATLKQIAATLDSAIAGTVRTALHDPAFQALEQGWLALRWLTRRIDFRAGIRLHVVAAGRQDLVRAFTGIVVPLAASARDEGRMACVVLGEPFDLGPDSGDFDAAVELAGAAEAAQVPVVAGVAPSLLGVRSLAAADGLDNLDDVLQDDDHVRWKLLRALDCSGWLALTMNRFLLRAPYGAEQDPVKDFALEENPPGGDAEYLWCGAPWVVAALVAASFERTGWGSEIVGMDDRGRVSDLPVRPLTLRTGEVVQAPLEALLSERRVLELSEGGVLALACRRNADAAFVVSAPMVHRPAAPDGGRPGPADARRDSLPFRLFLAQVTALLSHLVAWTDRTKAPEEVAATLAKGLEFLTSTREGPALRVAAEPTAGGAIALRIQPVGPPLKGFPDVALEIPRGS